MNRFNYLSTGSRTRIGLPLLAIDNRIRGPVAALAAILVLNTFLGAIQLARLEQARREYDTVSATLGTQRFALDQERQRRARVAATSRMYDAIAALQRSSLTRIDELARIGNELPGRTRLANLRYEDGTYWLEGTSDRAGTISAALLALRATAPSITPQLVSLSDTREGDLERVHYRLQLTTTR